MEDEGTGEEEEVEGNGGTHPKVVATPLENAKRSPNNG